MAEHQEEFDSEYRNNQARFQRRLLEAKWFGGTVQFGKPGVIGEYKKTFPGMNKIDPTVHLRWVEGADEHGKPINGVAATLEAIIDGEEDYLVVEAETRDQDRMVRRPARTYAKIAEGWAVRKWHLKRGTPVDETDNYQTEPGFVSIAKAQETGTEPTIKLVWDSPQAEPEIPRKKRGRLIDAERVTRTTA